MTDIRYWIGLSLVHDVGPVMSKRLLDHMESPENIFRAGMKDLLDVKGISRTAANNIKSFALWDDIERKLKYIEHHGIDVVHFSDALYPAPLRELPDSPVILYRKGEYCPDDRYAIAVVGSRKPTHYGEAVAQRMSNELAAAGFTIISGMARGIDSIAHRGALASGGRTIGIFGSGLDICYPAENRGLMHEVTLSGCIISEFLPGTMPNRENFPRRNRLISGLSLGVLVIEAAATSGSLITAGYALEHNREVFAVPGNITSHNSEGTNRLIQEGAKVALKTDDIIEELASLLTGFLRTYQKKTQHITEAEQNLCGFLSREPKHIDLIARESGSPAHAVLNLLLSLELKGVARQSNGKRFYLA